MAASTESPAKNRLLILLEITLIFAVFFLHGAWPVPDVNEAHYLGKAIHFGNPHWGANDLFLGSRDAHLVFCYVFGGLSRWLAPVTLAWLGRLTTWWLLACAWRRLNWAVLARRWWSIATGAIMLLLIDHFAMAGEWIVGGVEAKGYAYVLVLLGLEALVRDRWNRAWLLFGGAAMIHVLVGGWAAVAAGLAWLLLARANRPRLTAMGPGMVGGFLLALPSLVASLHLSWGIDPQIVDAANRIYVFERLEHHLYPVDFPVLRFALLLFAWLAVRWWTPDSHPAWPLHAFVAGSIAITMAGFAVAYATTTRPDWAAALLRFYWFRLSDVAVPIGVAVGVPIVIRQARPARPLVARIVTAALLLAAAGQVGEGLAQLAAGRPIRGTRKPETNHAGDWRDACRWIAENGQIPADATFLTPWTCRTFKWYTGRAEVVNWKDIPQDPASIVEWWRRRRTVHGAGTGNLDNQGYDSLAAQSEMRLWELGRLYKAEYVLTVVEPRLALPIEYQNKSFVVYRLPEQPPEPVLGLPEWSGP